MGKRAYFCPLLQQTTTVSCGQQAFVYVCYRSYRRAAEETLENHGQVREIVTILLIVLIAAGALAEYEICPLPTLNVAPESTVIGWPNTVVLLALLNTLA